MNLLPINQHFMFYHKIKLYAFDTIDVLFWYSHKVDDKNFFYPSIMNLKPTVWNLYYA